MDSMDNWMDSRQATPHCDCRGRVTPAGPAAEEGLAPSRSRRCRPLQRSRRAQRHTIGALSLLLVSLAWPTLGQEHRLTTSWRVEDPSQQLQVSDGAIQLELEDAVALALAQNLGLRIERNRRAQSLFGVLGNRGIYDLFLSSTGNSDDETSPAASVLDGSEIRQSESQSLNLNLDQLVNTGGTASLSWTNRRFESNSTFSQINPSYNVGFDAIFSQPLLRNFGSLATERQLRISRVNSDISLENLELAVINTIEAVENAYWSLVENREQLKVAEESLALAEELHEMNQVQVEVGTKAPLELITSEAGIATRQEEIIRAQAFVEDSADQLRELLNVAEGRLWSLPVVPVTDPQTARLEIDLAQAMETAVAHRAEVQSQQLAIRSLEIDSRFFRNQKMPRLDVQLRYGYNGLGGDVLVLAPGSDPFDPSPATSVIPGGIDDAFDQILEGDFDGWSLGLTFGYPLQNRGARAQSVVANLALEAGETRLEEVVLGVRTEVRRAARAVSTAAQQIDSARKSRELGERNLDAEQKRYENGLSTSFQVLEIQEDLSQARSREVSAITGYRRALTSYYKAIGQLLEENRVEIVDETDTDQLKPER